MMELNFPIFVDHSVIVDPENHKKHAIQVNAVWTMFMTLWTFGILRVITADKC